MAVTATAVILGLCLGNESPAESGADTTGTFKDVAAADDVLRLHATELGSLPPRSRLERVVPTETPSWTPTPKATPTATPKSVPFVWPADGWISQRMSVWHPNGIDIAVGTGNPVRAVRAGRVTFAGGNACCGLGYHVVVQHDAGWSSVYGHLSAFAVKKGDRVDQGQRLGSIGATGYASGPHLHFELRRSGVPVDPLSHLPSRPDLYIAPDEPAWTPAQQQPAAPPPPPPATATPKAPDSGTMMSAGQAISLAVGWMATQGELIYTVDPATCSASRAGPNWFVSCVGEPQGCLGQACPTTLTACVFEQPVLVTQSCP